MKTMAIFRVILANKTVQFTTEDQRYLSTQIFAYLLKARRLGAQSQKSFDILLQFQYYWFGRVS